jgi:hypothetical protein
VSVKGSALRVRIIGNESGNINPDDFTSEEIRLAADCARLAPTPDSYVVGSNGIEASLCYYRGS